MTFQRQIKRNVSDLPKWADDVRTDLTTCDLRDVWLERAKDGTDENAVVTAYFEADSDMSGGVLNTLNGISIDDGHGAAFYGIDHVEARLPLAVISALETQHTEDMR